MEGVALHKLGEIRVTCECCIRCADKVLLQKRSEDSKVFPGYWTFPGGHIDEGENAVHAVIREVKEETGLTILKENVSLKVNALNYHIDRKQVWVALGFLATVSECVAPVSTSEGEAKWFTIEEAQALDIFPPIKYYFDFILNGTPGTMFMAAELENAEIKRVLSEDILA